MIKNSKKVILMILSGWGISPSWGGNAISMAKPSNFYRLWREYPHKILKTEESKVIKKGKRKHILDISSGRFVESDFEFISKKITDLDDCQNQVLNLSIENCRKNDSNLHLIGLLSDSGILSHIDHLKGLIKYCSIKNFKNVYIHIILDNNQEAHGSIFNLICDLENYLKERNCGKIASICGRDFILDELKDLKEITKYLRLLTNGEGDLAVNSKQAITHSIKRGIEAEKVLPTAIIENSRPIIKINDFDSVILFNYNSEKSQKLLYLLSNGRAVGISSYHNIYLSTLSDYLLDSIKDKYHIIFNREKIIPNLSNVISQNDLSQLHIVESDSSLEATYYFDGLTSNLYPGEEIKIVQSLQMKPEQNPKMALDQIERETLKNIRRRHYDFIMVYINNISAVAKSQNIKATHNAVLAVDRAINNITEESLNHNYNLIITSDHGGAEEMVPINEFDVNRRSVESSNPVPFIFINNNIKQKTNRNLEQKEFYIDEILNANCSLKDIASTVLNIFNIKLPKGMTGKSLVADRS